MSEQNINEMKPTGETAGQKPRKDMTQWLRLANAVDGKNPDGKFAHTPDEANIKLIYALVTERQAEICAATSIKKWMTPEQVAKKGGWDPEEVHRELEASAIAGVMYVKDFDGVDKYKLSLWMPGILEHSASLMKENIAVADAFYNQDPKSAAFQAVAMPMGKGIMRAIPIQQAVESQSTIASYEQIQTYLDQDDFYSTCDCECRYSAHLAGDNCIKPWKDAEIQIGDQARYYVRTGRGRQISRKEAEEILLRYERIGCVHSIFNNEGENKTSIICNCDGDNCGILRHARWFQASDSAKSNYTSNIDPAKCVACGACVEACPMNAIRMGNSFCSIEGQTPKWAVARNTGWTQDHFDKNRHSRIMTGDQGTSPCKTQCPAHIAIQGYIKKAGEGKYLDALKVIKRENPFPAVCGRICPHTCENECSRNRVDDAVAIDDIKKFIADKELDKSLRYVPTVYEHYTEKVAVIGAGPAGMTCAYYLASEGYPVTVFDRQSTPGGMLKHGIPPFRLEKDVVDAEIQVLRDLGVEFINDTEVGKDVTIPQLREQGYKAFYIAIGAQNSNHLNVEGEDLEGVQYSLDLLRKVNHGSEEKLNGDTVVIGGGNAAIDAARAALRLGDGTVKMVCLESDEEMPTVPDEKDEAIEEGIQIENCWGPTRILGENGHVTGVEFRRCLSTRDEEGRFAPKFDDSETMVIPCSNVVISIGQHMDWGKLLTGTNAELTERNTMKVDPMTYQSTEEDIFGGGDAVNGPGFTIDAIATGKPGAISIHRYIRGYHMTMEREREYHAYDKDKADFSSYEAMKRQRPKPVNPDAAKGSLHDLRGTLTEEQIAKEAQRCMGCGVSVVDPEKCLGCGICYTKCEFDAIRLKKTRDIKPHKTASGFMRGVVSNVVVRKLKGLQDDFDSPASDGTDASDEQHTHYFD